jgi:hypothetical protein
MAYLKDAFELLVLENGVDTPIVIFHQLMCSTAIKQSKSKFCFWRCAAANNQRQADKACKVCKAINLACFSSSSNISFTAIKTAIGIIGGRGTSINIIFTQKLIYDDLNMR